MRTRAHQLVIRLVVVLTAVPLITDAQDAAAGTCPQSPNCPDRYLIVLGTGATPEVVRDTAWRLSPQNPNALPNPFTGRPFPAVDVVGQGKSSLGSPGTPVELARILTDHLNMHVLSSPSQIRGDYSVIMCHSNGCTLALEAIRRGDLKASHVYAFGTDWTTRYIPPSELRGAQLTFFGVRSDPIKYLPAPRLESHDKTVYLKFEVHFNRPGEIPRAMWNLATGRPNGYPYVDLTAPKGLSVLNPVDQHYLLESYFNAVGDYMRHAPPTEAARLSAPFQARQSTMPSSSPAPPAASTSSRQQNNVPPPGPPGPPPGGGGPGTHGGSGAGQPPGMMPATPSSARGGIKADIPVTDADFVSR